MTAHGSSATAAEGPGPWLEIAGPNDRWAASPPPPFVRTTSAWWSRGLRNEPGSRRKHTSQTLTQLSPGSVPGSPQAAARRSCTKELRLGLAKCSETTEAGSTGLSIS